MSRLPQQLMITPEKYSIIDDRIVDRETGEILDGFPQTTRKIHQLRTEFSAELGIALGEKALNLLKEICRKIEKDNYVPYPLFYINIHRAATKPLSKMELKRAKDRLLEINAIEIEDNCIYVSPLIAWKGDSSVREWRIREEISAILRKSVTQLLSNPHSYLTSINIRRYSNEISN